MKPEISQERLKEVLHYNPDTGLFTWKERRGGTAIEGVEAGWTNGSGYKRIAFNNVEYPGHHLAWLYMTGELPRKQLDHINGIRNDNRLSNLREATQKENMQNTRKHADNKSGYLGVYLHKHSGKFHSRIMVDGKQISLGYSDTAEAAHEAYKKAKAQYHKFNPEVTT